MGESLPGRRAISPVELLVHGVVVVVFKVVVVVLFTVVTVVVFGVVGAVILSVLLLIGLIIFDIEMKVLLLWIYSPILAVQSSFQRQTPSLVHL